VKGKKDAGKDPFSSFQKQYFNGAKAPTSFAFDSLVKINGNVKTNGIVIRGANLLRSFAT